MAVNNERSMNHDMALGATGRSMHSLTPERGGIVETEWPLERARCFMAGSWSPEYLADAISREKDPSPYMPDITLRNRITIVTGHTQRTRPVARTQFEANPFPTPLDEVHTSWPDKY